MDQEASSDHLVNSVAYPYKNNAPKFSILLEKLHGGFGKNA